MEQLRIDMHKKEPYVYHSYDIYVVDQFDFVGRVYKDGSFEYANSIDDFFADPRYNDNKQYPKLYINGEVFGISEIFPEYYALHVYTRDTSNASYNVLMFEKRDGVWCCLLKELPEYDCIHKERIGNTKILSCLNSEFDGICSIVMIPHEVERDPTHFICADENSMENCDQVYDKNDNHYSMCTGEMIGVGADVINISGFMFDCITYKELGFIGRKMSEVKTYISPDKSSYLISGFGGYYKFNIEARDMKKLDEDEFDSLMEKGYTENIW